MGGPKINRTGQNRIGRRPRINKALGIGKRARKIKHNAKKRRNMNKKMLKYYDDVANPERAAAEKAQEVEEAHSLTPQIAKNLSGKKLRKLRKIIQRTQREKSKMEVEVVAASKKEKVTKTTDKLETEETARFSDSSYEDVEMNVGDDE